MHLNSKTFRVFVSSTFADFVEERDALQRHVWPEIAKLCETQGFRFQAIDLRWGISEEAGLDQRTSSICLQELERCQSTSPRPNFIVLLGNRYGWRPLPEAIDASEFDEILSRVEQTSRTGASLLQEWYLLDENAVPAAFYLRPRRSETPNEVDFARWSESVERPLQEMLLRSAAEIWPTDPSRRVKYERSLTEQEILAGALNPSLENAHEHVFAYFREVEILDELTSAMAEDANHLRNYVDFVEGTPDCDLKARRLLRELKRRLKDTLGKDHIREYPENWTGTTVSQFYLEQLCSDVLEDIWSVIQAEINERLRDSKPLHTEIAAHRSFAEQHGAADDLTFRGRSTELQQITSYLATYESDRPLVVVGPPGSGKSSLLARVAIEESKPEAHSLTIHRFIGVTPNSIVGSALLTSLCEELGEAFKIETSIPQDYNRLVGTFHDRLTWATQQRPLHLFLDAVDQLSDADGSNLLDWIPLQLPPSVRIVLSVLDDSATRNNPNGHSPLEILHQRFRPEEDFLKVGDYSLNDAAMLLDCWLSSQKRRITEDQNKLTMTAFENCRRPLLIKLLFEEAKLWRSVDITRNIPLSGTSDEVLSSVIHRLFDRLSQANNHGDLFLSRAVGYLVASRNGLTEEELLTALSSDIPFMDEFQRRAQSVNQPLPIGVDSLPVAVWVRLYSDLQPYLTVRQNDGVTVITFFHRSVERVAKHRFLDSVETEVFLHAGLARMWQQRWAESNDRRALRELPYHYMKSQDAESLYNLSRDNTFLRQQLLLPSAGQTAVLETLRFAFEMAVSRGDCGPLVEFLLKPQRLLQFKDSDVESDSPWTQLKQRGMNSAIRSARELSEDVAFAWLILIAWETADGPDKELSGVPLSQALELNPARIELNLAQWPFPPIGDDHPSDDRPGSGEWYAFALASLSKINEVAVMELQRRNFDDPLRLLLAERLIAIGNSHCAEQILNDLETDEGKVQLHCILSSDSPGQIDFIDSAAKLLDSLEDIAEHAPSYRCFAVTCLERGQLHRFTEILGQIQRIQQIVPKIEIGSRDLINLEAELLFSLIPRQLTTPGTYGQPAATASRLLELGNAEQLPEAKPYFSNDQKIPLLWSWIHNRLASMILQSNDLTLFQNLHDQLEEAHFRDRWKMLSIVHRAKRSKADSAAAIAPFMQEALGLHDERYQGLALGELSLLLADHELTSTLLEVSSVLSACGGRYAEDDSGIRLTRISAAWESNRRQTITQFARAGRFEQALHLATEIRMREQSSITNLGGGDEWRVRTRLEGEKWQYHASLRDLAMICASADHNKWLSFLLQSIRCHEHREWLLARRISANVNAANYSDAREMIGEQLTLVETGRPSIVASSAPQSRIVPKFSTKELSTSSLNRHLTACDHLLRWKRLAWPWYKSPSLSILTELFAGFTWHPTTLPQKIFNAFLCLIGIAYGFILVMVSAVLVSLIQSVFAGQVLPAAVLASAVLAGSYLFKKLGMATSIRLQSLRTKYVRLFGTEFFFPRLGRIAELYLTAPGTADMEALRDMNEIDESHVKRDRGLPSESADANQLCDSALKTFENDALVCMSITSLRFSPSPQAIAVINRYAEQEAYLNMGDHTLGMGYRSVDTPRPTVTRELCNTAILSLCKSYARNNQQNEALDVLESLLSARNQLQSGINGKMACAYQLAIRRDYDGIRHVINREIRHYHGTDTLFTIVVGADMPPLASVVDELVTLFCEQGLTSIASDLAQHFDIRNRMPVFESRHVDSELKSSINKREQADNSRDENDADTLQIPQFDSGKSPEDQEAWLILSLTKYQRAGTVVIHGMRIAPIEFVKQCLQALPKVVSPLGPVHFNGISIADILHDDSYAGYCQNAPALRRQILRGFLARTLWFSGETEICVNLLRRGDFRCVADDVFDNLCRRVDTETDLKRLLSALELTSESRHESTQAYLHVAESLISLKDFREHLKQLGYRWRNHREKLYALINGLAQTKTFGASNSVRQMLLVLFRERERERRQDEFLSYAMIEPERSQLLNIDLLELSSDLNVQSALMRAACDADVLNNYESSLKKLSEHCQRSEVPYVLPNEAWQGIIVDRAEVRLRQGFPEVAIEMLDETISQLTDGKRKQIPFRRLYPATMALKAEAHLSLFNKNPSLHEELIHSARAAAAGLKWCNRFDRTESGRQVDEYRSKARYSISKCLEAAGLTDEALAFWNSGRWSKMVRDEGFDFAAKLYQKLGRFEESLEQCETQLSHNPHNALCRCRRLEILLKLGRIEEASKMRKFERSVLFPTAERGLFALLSAMIQLNHGTPIDQRTEFQIGPRVTTGPAPEYDLAAISCEIEKMQPSEDKTLLLAMLARVKQTFTAPVNVIADGQAKTVQVAFRRLLHEIS